ncbi:hypothetical protein SPFM12_00226 [Salmonella phage SPFM12]|nr:hypothetical protein SPFM12_00226 [Salmonella phage SPFM12]
MGEVFQSAVDGQTMASGYPGMPVKYVFANEYGVYTRYEMSLGTIVQTTWNRSTHGILAPIDPDKHFSDTDKPQRSKLTPDKFVAQADPAAYPGGVVNSVRVLDGRSSSFTPGDISMTSSLEYRDQAALNQGTGYRVGIDRTTDIAGNVIYLICGGDTNNTTKPKLVIYNLPREQAAHGVFQYLQRWYLYRPWDSLKFDFLSVFDYLQNHYGVYSKGIIEYDEEEQQAYRDIVIPDSERSILADTLPEGVAAEGQLKGFLRNRQVGGIYHETDGLTVAQSDEKSIALVTLELMDESMWRGIVINNRDHNAESPTMFLSDLKVKLLLRRGQKIAGVFNYHLTLAIPYSHMRMITSSAEGLKMLSIIHTGHFTRDICLLTGLPAIDYGIFLTVHGAPVTVSLMSFGRLQQMANGHIANARPPF